MLGLLRYSKALVWTGQERLPHRRRNACLLPHTLAVPEIVPNFSFHHQYLFSRTLPWTASQADLAGYKLDERETALDRAEETRPLPASLLRRLFLQRPAVSPRPPIPPNDAHHMAHHFLIARRDLIGWAVISQHLHQSMLQRSQKEQKNLNKQVILSGKTPLSMTTANCAINK